MLIICFKCWQQMSRLLTSASCQTNLKGSKVHSTQRAFHYSLASRALMLSPDLHTFYMHTVTTTIPSKKQKRQYLFVNDQPALEPLPPLHEGHTGEYCHEVVTVWTRHSKVCTKRLKTSIVQYGSSKLDC